MKRLVKGLIIGAVTLMLVGQASTFGAKHRSDKRGTAAAETAGVPAVEDAGRIVLDKAKASGGATVTGRVVLARPLITTMRVVLSSNNPAAQLPTTAVQIAPNQTASEPFTIRTTAVTQSTRVVISAVGTALPLSAAQFTPAALVLEPAILKSLSLSRTSAVSGTAESEVKGLVELEEATPPGGGAVVQLTASPLPAPASFPSAVRVAQGERTATFVVQAGAVSATSTFTIAADLGGVSKSVNLTVEPLKIVELIVPASGTGGSAFNGTVRLSGHILASKNVTVSTNPVTFVRFGNPTTGRPNTLLSIAAGSDSATFQAFAVPVTQDTSVTITALLPGISEHQTLSKTITVTKQARTMTGQTVASIVEGSWIYCEL